MKNEILTCEENLLDKVIKNFISIKRSEWDRFGRQHDWRHCEFIQYDYNKEYNCSDGHCNSICRCGVITDIELSKFDTNAMVSDITSGIENDILIYCIDRIIRLQKLTEDCFQLHTCSGYYGEEIDGLYLDESYEKIISDNLSKLKGISDADRIKFVLTLEYGYLLDVLVDTSSAMIHNIDINNISFQEEYRKKINTSENYYDEKFQLSRGIFIAKGNEFRLIDGYHRVMKAKSLGMDQVKGIVLL